MRLVIRPLAIQDIEDIWLYIADDSPGSADTMIDTFTDRFTFLQEQSHLGHACPELGENLRRLVVQSYCVFYTVTPGSIVIERVLHSSRDMDSLFS